MHFPIKNRVFLSFFLPRKVILPFDFPESVITYSQNTILDPRVLPLGAGLGVAQPIKGPRTGIENHTCTDMRSER